MRRDSKCLADGPIDADVLKKGATFLLPLARGLYIIDHSSQHFLSLELFKLTTAHCDQ